MNRPSGGAAAINPDSQPAHARFFSRVRWAAGRADERRAARAAELIARDAARVARRDARRAARHQRRQPLTARAAQQAVQAAGAALAPLTKDTARRAVLVLAGGLLAAVGLGLLLGGSWRVSHDL